MGHENSKQKLVEYFTQEEKNELKRSLGNILNRHDNISHHDFEHFLKLHIKEEFASKLSSFILANKEAISFPEVISRLGPLLTGSPQCRCMLIKHMTGENENINCSKLIELLEELLHIYEKSASDSYLWGKGTPESHKCVSFSMLHTLLHNRKSYKQVFSEKEESKYLPHIDYASFENWFCSSNLFTMLFSEVLTSIFFRRFIFSELLPKTETRSTIISLSEVMFLNSFIPMALRSEWRIAFSVSVHGWSFTTFMKQIVRVGPTLIIVEDSDKNIFGGFASASWEVRPQFHGTPESFLFMLFPLVGVFHSTGYNKNFMYLNYLEKNTMPNGLGMGGREELFGLWLDSDFGKGKAAATCTTFHSPQLSSSEEFTIKNLEVWALGEEKANDDEDDNEVRSALDKNPEARAMLDMIGHTEHSKGLREDA